jgi:hypothetical protein
MDYSVNPAVWKMLASTASNNTTRPFTWFIEAVTTLVSKRRAALLFRDLQVWYSPTYRF